MAFELEVCVINELGSRLSGVAVVFELQRGIKLQCFLCNDVNKSTEVGLGDDNANTDDRVQTAEIMLSGIFGAEAQSEKERIHVRKRSLFDKFRNLRLNSYHSVSGNKVRVCYRLCIRHTTERAFALYLISEIARC